jgi:glycosyltransferase involved in cell wall biosynthesis
VLAQARASGLPIVTTLHGAGTDIVTDGHDGWIVPVRDPAALAACLRRLAADRSALAAMADRVAGDFESQGWQIAAEQFEQVCASLLAGTRHLETT